MADFVKKTWVCGDTITADELNRLEGGVEDALDCCGGNSVLVVKPISVEEAGGMRVTTFSCTYAELINALREAGARIIFDDEDTISQPIIEFELNQTSFKIVYGFGDSSDWQRFEFDLPLDGFDSAITVTRVRYLERRHHVIHT